MLSIKSIGAWCSVVMLLCLVSFRWHTAASEQDTTSSSFYTCPDGYQLEVQTQAVRCIEPDRITYHPPLDCAHQLSIDAEATRDHCISVDGDQMPSQCAQGLRLEIAIGRDRCQQISTLNVTYPSIPTER